MVTEIDLFRQEQPSVGARHGVVSKPMLKQGFVANQYSGGWIHLLFNLCVCLLAVIQCVNCAIFSEKTSPLISNNIFVVNDESFSVDVDVTLTAKGSYLVCDFYNPVVIVVHASQNARAEEQLSREYFPLNQWLSIPVALL